ncbi:hypothetical protein C8R47DRAFT_1155390 [Mycena vitilis]|nr:hypothetical protein C8R47DRAFT_1155390 [Mycena vitilis]
MTDGVRCPQCQARSAMSSLLEEVQALVNAFVPGTRYHTLLTSNQAPEDHHLPFIRSAISKSDAPLARLDDEISKLRDTLKGLEEARASLSSHRTQNKAILSAMRRMPPEMLGEIFLRTLPSSPDTSSLLGSDMGASPWVLTMVSSSWRSVALAQPSLWSRICIDYSIKFPYSLSLVEAQLQRSQKLNVHFYGSEGLPSQPQIEIFNLLAQHSSRWERLSVGLTSSIARLLPAVRDRVPSLEKLWIQWDIENNIESDLDCFHTAPSLVDVGIYNYTRDIEVAIPLHQLTRYELNCSWRKHKGILKVARNLVEAHVDIDYDEQNWGDEVIDALHLRRLYVSDAAALRYLRVPVLEELALRAWKYEDLASLLDRSGCRLRSLATEVPESHTILKLMRKFSTVTELVVEVKVLSLHEIKILISDLTTATVAPQLRSLFIGYEESDYLDYTAYFEMLKSRLEGENCALQTAVLAIKGTGPSYGIIQHLKTLRRAGFELLVVEGEEANDEMRRRNFDTTWT